MRKRWLAVLAGAVAVVASIQWQQWQGGTMAEPITKLGWEWRAERALAQRAALRLERVKPEGGGLFGILKSPSLGGSLPDAMAAEAVALAVQGEGPLRAGARLAFRIPKLELKGAAAGAVVMIGVIGDNAVCLTPAPEPLDDADVSAWLADAPCA